MKSRTPKQTIPKMEAALPKSFDRESLDTEKQLVKRRKSAISLLTNEIVDDETLGHTLDLCIQFNLYTSIIYRDKLKQLIDNKKISDYELNSVLCRQLYVMINTVNLCILSISIM